MSTTSHSRPTRTTQKLAPGFDGSRELGTRQVPDPYAPGNYVCASVNIRCDPIATLAARGKITPAQRVAGERFMQLHERASLSRIHSIDPSKTRVSGSLAGDPLTDALLTASRELAQATDALGPVYARVLTLVLEHRSLGAAAGAWAQAGGVLTNDRQAFGYLVGTIVDALDRLVRHWRLEGRGTSYQGIGGSRIPTTGPARQISVGRHGDAVVETRRPR
jgi:hypothetical protein